MRILILLLLAALPVRAELLDDLENWVHPASKKKPNVIILIADQLRAQSVGYAGDEKARTPNIDKLAAQSLNFSEFVANTPVCSAFRASLLTGKYASSTGVVVNELRLNPNHDSIAHVLGKAGWKCDHIGKWHLWAAMAGKHALIQNSYTPPGPYRMGFDDYWAAYNFGHRNFSMRYFLAIPEPIQIEGFSSTHFTDLAIERINEHAKKEEPFLMTVAYSPPHDPWVPDNVPKKFLNMFKDVDFPLPKTWADSPDMRMDRNTNSKRWLGHWKPMLENFQRVYYAMTTALDHEIGRVIKAIDDAGIADDTILVFTSDHGEMFGAQGRVFKMTFYEESCRVPLLIRWPGKIKHDLHPDGVREWAVSTVDVMPTLLGLCGQEVPIGVEGMDLSGLCLGPRGRYPAMAYLQGMGHTFLWNDGFEWRAVRDRYYTYAVYRSDGKELLFHNEKDPLQTTDVAGDPAHAEALAKYREAMKNYREGLKDEFQACSWYRDNWTDNRVIVRGAKGELPRRTGPDVEVDVKYTGFTGTEE